MNWRALPENIDYGEHRIADLFVHQLRRDDFFAPDDEIEVIDLDTPRRDVKPTTWH